MLVKGKIISFDQLVDQVAEARKAGKKVVLSHGVFDLLHIGHVKHLMNARANGDLLVVVVTPDRFVRKGFHRPAFPEHSRAEGVAALYCVDLVAIGIHYQAHEVIGQLCPSIFAVGSPLPSGNGHHHAQEQPLDEAILERAGCQLLVTDEERFSTSSLINRHLNVFAPEVREFLNAFSMRYGSLDITAHLESLRGLKVLCVGETIIDEYRFCDVLSKANKDPILVGQYLYEKRYTGGILAIANHVSNFCRQVSLLTILGDENSHRPFIDSKLNPNISRHFFTKKNSPTIVKRRYVQEYMAVKLFEVYTMRNQDLLPEEDRAFCSWLDELLPQFDLVIVADYGHGLFTPRSIDLVCQKAGFLAVNAQTNAGNAGFNLITKYPRADYATMDEREARLETRDMVGEVRSLVKRIAAKMDCHYFMVTRGKNGCLLYNSPEKEFVEVPAFSIKVIDRIGAGDAVLSLTAPALAVGTPLDLVGFIGNVAGAEACMMMGNEASVDPESLSAHMDSLLK